jgi:hypothetical protein
VNTLFVLLISVLARAVHALCRIGDELYVEPEPEKISFRAVSASKSAYASFTFFESFFSYYNYEQQWSQEEDVTCKVSMKVRKCLLPHNFKYFFMVWLFSVPVLWLSNNKYVDSLCIKLAMRIIHSVKRHKRRAPLDFYFPEAKFKISVYDTCKCMNNVEFLFLHNLI